MADPANQRIADRIALNARDAGELTVFNAPPNSAGEMFGWWRCGSGPRTPPVALARSGLGDGVSAACTLRMDSPEALYAAERALLDGFRVVPLFHLPDVYGVNPRVKGGPGITPLGEWRFESLWVETGRP